MGTTFREVQEEECDIERRCLERMVTDAAYEIYNYERVRARVKEKARWKKRKEIGPKPKTMEASDHGDEVTSKKRNAECDEDSKILVTTAKYDVCGVEGRGKRGREEDDR